MKTLWCENLKPGDCFLVEWADWSVNKYRVVENRPKEIVANRWISTQNKWTPWTATIKKSLPRLVTARPCEVDA